MRMSIIQSFITKHIQIVCCIALLCCPTLASGHPSTIQHLGVSEGLNDLLVNTIHRDSTGLVWLGTGSSVELFDGVRFIHFPLPDGNYLSQRVTAIVGHSTSQLYVGNSNGLYCLSAPENAPIAQAQWQRIGEHQIMGAVSDLLLTDQILYIATDRGLYTMPVTAPLEITHHPLHPNALSVANQLRHLCMDKDGVLWMTSPVGLHALLPNQQISHYVYTNLPEDGFNSICYVNDTLLLGTSRNGVYYFSIPSATYNLYRPEAQPVSALQAVGNDTLLIATDGGGVQILNRHTQATLASTFSSFSSNNVYSMLYDSDGLLWVGYYQQGLDYTIHQDRTIQVYNTPTWDSYGKAVRAFAAHGPYKVIGTRNGLFLIDERTGQVRTYNQSQLNAQMIFALCYHNDRFYVGTFGGGLYALSPVSGQLTRVGARVGSQIFCITPDSLGLLWIGSDQGVFALDNNRIVQHFNASFTKLPQGYVYAIFFDRMGHGWFCTQSGMAIYDPEQRMVRTDVFPNSFPQRQSVRSVYQDQQGNFYFLPDKGRVFCCSEHLRPIAKDFPEADALFLTQDAKQRLWLGTTNGLYCLSSSSSVYYDFASGLPDNTFTLCQPYWDADSTLWMGHSRGLVYLHPLASSPSRPLAHSPMVIDVQQQDADVTFLFSDLRFSLPQHVHYTYRLKGFEVVEHTLDGTSQCSYSNLPMGRYTLVLTNTNHPNQSYEYALRVPMSRQDWLVADCIGLSVIIIVLIVGFVLYYRRYHPKKDTKNNAEASDNIYRTFHLSSQQLKSLAQRFSQTISHDQLYLNPTLRIADVAAKIGTSSYSLSYMLSQHLHINFNDYINHLRIEAFCKRVQQGDAKRYSIDTLAQECGFVSRAGFFRNFKKQMHQTPNEYIQSVKN